MVVRNELLALLQQRLKGRLPDNEIARLAEEIAGLDQEWEEVDIDPETMGYTLSVDCPDICALAEAISKGEEFRFFRKKVSASSPAHA